MDSDKAVVKVPTVEVERGFDNGDLAPATVAAYAIAYGTYERWCVAGAVEPTQVGSVRAYRDHLVELGRSASTIQQHMSAVRRTIIATARRSLPEPALQVLRGALQEIKAPTTRTGPLPDSKRLTRADLGMLLEAAGPITALWIRVLAWTGCRVSEVINARLSDLKVNGWAELRILGKGRRERKVTLPSELVEQIMARAPQTWLIETGAGAQCNRFTVDTLIRRVGERVLGRKVSAHMMRHFHATELISRGTDASAVADRLGHADAGMTLRVYTHTAVKQADLAGLVP